MGLEELKQAGITLILYICFGVFLNGALVRVDFFVLEGTKERRTDEHTEGPLLKSLRAGPAHGALPTSFIATIIVHHIGCC